MPYKIHTVPKISKEGTIQASKTTFPKLKRCMKPFAEAIFFFETKTHSAKKPQ